MCARTRNRLKKANKAPETVSTYKGKQSRRPSPTPRTSERQEETETGTETSREETEKPRHRAETETVKRSELFTASTPHPNPPRAATDRSRYCSVATIYTAIVEYQRPCALDHPSRILTVPERPTQAKERPYTCTCAKPYTERRATYMRRYSASRQKPLTRSLELP